MRHGIVVGVLLYSSTTLADSKADSKAIDKTVKASIANLAKLEDNAALGFDKHALVIDDKGSKVNMSSEDGCVPGAVANAFYGCVQGDIVHKVATVTSGSDGGVGWFIAPYTSIVTGENPEGGPSSPYKQAIRMSGIVAGSGTSWTILAAMYAHPISDKELLAGTGGKPASGAPSTTGDPKVAAIVTGWFTSGFAGAGAKKGTLIASGTSPSELKTGAGAVALAKSWDKLKLAPTSIDVALFEKDKIGWVIADVTMPRKNGKGAVAMKLAAVIVPDGDTWRWVSLAYQPDWKPGM